MMKLIDLICEAGHIHEDVFVENLDGASLPVCQCLVTRTQRCGKPTQRAWLSSPSITPQGTKLERNRSVASGPPPVDEKKIAAEVMFEVEQKWQRYSDPKVAEQHVSREINEAAGIADASGNEKPIPKPDPITFAKPSLAECAS
jgi:hypothetical protein